MKKIDCCLSFYTDYLKVKVVATSGFENSHEGFVKLRKWLNRKQNNNMVLFVNMEATWTYNEEAAHFLACVGYRRSVIKSHMVYISSFYGNLDRLYKQKV